MSEDVVHFYNKPPPFTAGGAKADRVEPTTCTEAEPFALRVLDDSMEPEFRQGCIIVIDPTGRATNGSFVLARQGDSGESNRQEDNQDDDSFVFRQLRQANDAWTLCALNENYQPLNTATDLSAIIGVIVQRAGVRRSYHKHYS